jgi:hypothetical protein
LCGEQAELITGAASPPQHLTTPSAHEPATIDPALLDEIQIVTTWMKQKTREGAWRRLPRGEDPDRAAAELERWLLEEASGVTSGSVPVP